MLSIHFYAGRPACLSPSIILNISVLTDQRPCGQTVGAFCFGRRPSRIYTVTMSIGRGPGPGHRASPALLAAIYGSQDAHSLSATYPGRPHGHQLLTDLTAGRARPGGRHRLPSTSQRQTGPAHRPTDDIILCLAVCRPNPREIGNLRDNRLIC